MIKGMHIAAGAACIALAAAGCGASAATSHPAPAVTVTVTAPAPAPVVTDPSGDSSPSPAQEFLDFTCTMDQPGVSDDYTVNVTNPGASSISMGVVTLNFSDAAGNVIDTENYVPNGAVTIPAGGSAVLHAEASESTSPPSSCQETGWQLA
jgi:hypothetical protein